MRNIPRKCLKFEDGVISTASHHQSFFRNLFFKLEQPYI